MALLIATDGTGLTDYTQLVTLDSVVYVLGFRYIIAESCWYMNIALTNGATICQGIKLVCSYPLLWSYNDPNLPDGTFMVVPSPADDSPPGLNDLAPGGRCALLYLEKGEISASVEANRL